MRPIKFRGFNDKNKKWIYGYYLVNRGEHFICDDGIQPPDMTWEDFLVSPDSVGQFAGMKDKNGREIYEGDIVEFYNAQQHSQLLSSDPMSYQHVFCIRKHQAVVEFYGGCFFVGGDFLYIAAFESVGQAMRILQVEDKDSPFDSEGTEINESIVGYKVIGNIHENPEQMKEERK